MSPNRYPISARGRHRKPRRSRAGGLLRGGLLTSVVGTAAVAGTAAPASAAETTGTTETTAELPLLDGVLAEGGAQAAAATHAYIGQAEHEAALAKRQDQVAAAAQRTAAERAAEERREAEARERAEQERAEQARAAASRDEERTTLSTAAQPDAQPDAQPEAAPEPAAPEPSTASAPAPAGSGASAVVDFALAQVGDGYSMGATGPDVWDCSSLVQAAYANAGVSLPRTSGPQSTAGTQVSLDALQPGDILYWGGAGSAYHVAIYIGGGQFVGAQNSSTGVVTRDLSWDTPTGAVRVL